jgi:hypothetical protein
MVNLPDSWTFTISILSGKYTLRYIRIQIVKYGESVQTELFLHTPSEPLVNIPEKIQR